MISKEIRHLLNLADESHEVAKALINMGHARFSAAQSYFTIFYLTQALFVAVKGINIFQPFSGCCRVRQRVCQDWLS